MEFRTRLVSLVLPLAVALAIAPNALLTAQASAAETPPNCANGDVMMTSAHPLPAIKPSGDVDRDFARAMSTHLAAMMTMERMEIACGKDAKTKAFAQSTLDKQLEEIRETRLLIGPGG